MNTENFPHDNFTGYGMSPASDVVELRKALEAGYGDSPTTQTGGGALRVESLEASLKILSFRDRHIQFWKDVPKTAAASTVEEYARLSEYGGQERFGFIAEGELPEESTATYDRQAALVKYIGDTRVVSHPMTLVRAIPGDVRARENANAIMRILRTMEWGLFFGNSKLGLAGAEFVEFDGLQQLCGLTENKWCKPVTERDIRDYSQRIQDEGYGIPTHWFAHPKVVEEYAKEYIPAYHMPMPTQSGAYKVGFNIGEIVTGNGTVLPRPSLFLKKTPSPPTGASSTKSPEAAATVVGVSGAGSGVWANVYATGVSVLYRATIANAYGESAITQSGAVALTAGELTKDITVTVTNPGAFTNAPKFINLYRQDTVGGVVVRDYGLISRTAITTAAGGGTTAIVDSGTVVPQTYETYIGELTPEVIEFKQLLDMVSMDLAVISPAYRWMVLLYGVLVVYAPNKWMRVINIEI